MTLAATAVALAALAAFAAALFGLPVLSTLRHALTEGQAGVSAMLDPELSEDDKERTVQRSGLRLLGTAGLLLALFALVLLAAWSPVWVADAAGLVPSTRTLDALLSWPFLLVTSAGAILLWWAFSGRSTTHHETHAQSNYSASDRLVHKVAFANPGVQHTLSRLEDRLWHRSIENLSETAPVFVTGLPRAGTTILLNVLAELPGIATHRYRDMPFVMAPLLWNKLSSPFQRVGTMHERAHGDGIKVGFDSPEAFEEVIWRSIHPAQAGHRPLRVEGPEMATEETKAQLSKHFSKIRLLRGMPEGRYLSKNNGNIARLGLLSALFPDAAIITPIREPTAHAASLYRQHVNFSAQQQSDSFVARYMRDIGHLEFGDLHRPIDFAGFEPAGQNLDTPDYWLDYWIAAHREIQRHADRVILVSHEVLSARPDEVMTRLCSAAGLDSAGADFSRHFRPPSDRDVSGGFKPDRLTEARSLYAELNSRSIVLG